jgi:hypothetical protein
MLIPLKERKGDDGQAVAGERAAEDLVGKHPKYGKYFRMLKVGSHENLLDYILILFCFPRH